MKGSAKIIVQIVAVCLGAVMCVHSGITRDTTLFITGHIWLAAGVVLGVMPSKEDR